MMEFEWDAFKAESNFKKHGVTFSEAMTVWLDKSSWEELGLHSLEEERWLRLGLSRKGRVLLVVYTERIIGEKIRIISARKANRTETDQYDSRVL